MKMETATPHDLATMGTPAVRAASRIVGALARQDGLITADEFQAAAIAGLNLSAISDNRVLVDSLILNSLLDSGNSLEDAIRELSKITTDLRKL